MLVSGEDDPDVDVAGVRLLLPEVVVDPGLDVGAESGRRQPLRREPVFLLLRAVGLVAAVTFEPAVIKSINQTINESVRQSISKSVGQYININI